MTRCCSQLLSLPPLECFPVTITWILFPANKATWQPWVVTACSLALVVHVFEMADFFQKSSAPSASFFFNGVNIEVVHSFWCDLLARAMNISSSTSIDKKGQFLKWPELTHCERTSSTCLLFELLTLIKLSKWVFFPCWMERQKLSSWPIWRWISRSKRPIYDRTPLGWG